MNHYLLLLKLNIRWILIASILLFWGIMNDGYIRISIAVLILYFTFKSIINDSKYITELNNWIKLNQDKLILFYPTTKPIQENIRNKFIPKIPFEIMEVYYDGPKLIGDIKRSIVFEIIRWYPKVNIHSPSILKVVNKSILVEALDDLNTINLTDNDYKKLIEKIEKIKTTPNTVYN
ncbi:hypothetical protein H7F37_04120 [Winogradskyella sp. PAMC22761]|nr:hypothetical protein H7F37_04120 [Winogradskyella sp. PAMC22761]